jgi:vacuolar-type H+-ATPase subunit I/STV1
MAHAGSWLGLPDFGATEWLQGLGGGGVRNAQGGSTLRNPSVQEFLPSNFRSAEQIKLSPSGGQQSSQSGLYGGVSGVKNSSLGTSPSSTQTYENAINQQTDDLGSILDRDYETAMGALASQEEGLQGAATNAVTQAEAGYAPARTQIQNEKTTAETGVQGEVQTAEKQSKTAMQEARDLYRQTQQQNIAQLSGLGISSSSVAEALAERLGVETARRIAGVTGSLGEVRQNAAKELTRIKTYYEGKLSDLETQLGAAKSNIQTQLLEGIRQINTARNQAATDKANRRTELISNAQTAIAQIQSNAQSFAQTLELWAKQKTDALTPITTDPNYLANLQTQTANINKSFAPTGFEYAPNFNQYGQASGYTLKKKSGEEDTDNPY